jgi:hypothetical protein
MLGVSNSGALVQNAGAPRNDGGAMVRAKVINGCRTSKGWTKDGDIIELPEHEFIELRSYHKVVAAPPPEPAADPAAAKKGGK